MDVGKGREQEAEASPKAPIVGALLHAIHGVMQYLH